MQPKNSDKAPFHTENGGLLSKSAFFALRTSASLVVGGLQGGPGKLNLLMGVVHALCRNDPSWGDRFGYVDTVPLRNAVPLCLLIM